MSIKYIDWVTHKFGDLNGQVIADGIWHRVRTQTNQLVVPVLGMILLWELAALLVNDPNTLPGPLATFEQTYLLVTQPDFRGLTALDHLRVTFVRVVIASVIGLVLAVTFGILMTTNDWIEESLDSVLPFAMTIPTVVVILVAMVWFDFSQVGVILAVVVASTPFGIINVWEGAQDVDVDLVTMARSFDASSAMVWRHIYVPHLLPYLFGSYRYILGMVWKITVLGEVFGLSNGFGAMFRYYFQLGEIVVVLGYLMLFVVVVLVIEYGILKPMENYLFSWRGH